MNEDGLLYSASHEWARVEGDVCVVGAGIFGFLINLPIVSYYEVGTQLTPNHGHAAMMGVFGMLAIGLMVFALRHVVDDDLGVFPRLVGFFRRLGHLGDYRYFSLSCPVHDLFESFAPHGTFRNIETVDLVEQ